MSSKNNALGTVLRNLLGDKTLVLRSSTNPNKVPYTKEERNLAKHIMATLAPHAGIKASKQIEPDAKVQELVNTVAASMKEGELSVVSIAKASLRAQMASVVEHNSKPENANEQIVGFPKKRDPTSIVLILRKACDELGITEEQTNALFPKPGAKEEQEAA